MSAVSDLVTSRDNYAAILAAQTAAWVAAGCPPTMSIDGESYDWNGWRDSIQKQIRELTETINLVSAPWVVRSRGRA